MGRAVLAHVEGVVGVDVQGGHALERGHAQGVSGDLLRGAVPRGVGGLRLPGRNNFV